MKRFNYKDLLFDAVYIISGTTLYCIGISGFLEPADISPGGVTGIATLLNHIIGVPAGLTLFLLNLPLLILGLIKLGGSMTVKTIISTALSSVFLDLFDAFLPPISRDTILCALAGGLLVGTGMGVLFLNGATSGGTDIAAKLVKIKYPYVSTGRLILIFDALVIGTASLFYGNIESALYAALGVFVSTTVIDRILYGGGGGKLAFIITDNPADIKNSIFHRLKRGVTEITIKGGYSGQDKTLMLCAIRRNQLGEFQRAVKETDQNSFIILTEVGEILGRGFN